MHVAQFLSLHGNIGVYTQLGLEKSTDLIATYFQRSSNHHEMDCLKQILEKQNRIDSLEEYQRDKSLKKCSKCDFFGHNKRSCKIPQRKDMTEVLNEENTTQVLNEENTTQVSNTIEGSDSSARRRQRKRKRRKDKSS